MTAFQVGALLKEDALGRVERIDRVLFQADGRPRHVPCCVRRVAHGGRIPGSGLVARRLAARERAALGALAGVAGVPELVHDERLLGVRSLDGTTPASTSVVLRSWLDGEALSAADRLPRDFFDRLDELVQVLHARGVCHNDLHKEQNVLVGADGQPALLDFQLASVHRGRGRLFQSRVKDDLRHVEKHRRRYTRLGRGPDGPDGPGEPTRGAGAGLRRSGVALVWRKTGKPLYNGVTRGLLRTRDGEARRPSSGPWPVWTNPVGPRGR